MFEWIARLVARRGLLIVVAWAAAVVLLWKFAPPWERVARDDDVRFFPAGSISVDGQILIERGFPKDAASSTIVLIFERPDGPLTAEDRAYVASVSDSIRALIRTDDDPESKPDWKIRKLDDFRTPFMGSLFQAGSGTGGEGQCVLTFIRLNVNYLAKQARLSVNRIQDLLAEAEPRKPAGLNLELTGSAVVGHDQNEANNASIDATTYATIGLVVAILLFVYRSPLLAFIPLFTIAISVWVSLKGLPFLADIPFLNYQVINITRVFVIVVLFGAGTDYCLFLIARYREELANGLSKDDAISTAIRQVGHALVASAGTVIIGLGMLWFSTFSKVQYTGPSIAISLAVSLVAALTLAPVLLRWLGRAVFWPFSPPQHHAGRDTEQESQEESPLAGFWARVANVVVRYPGWILGASVAAMLPFVVLGLQTRTAFNQLTDLGPDAPSVIGARLIRKYYPIGEMGPTTVLVRHPKIDFRTPEGQQSIEDLCQRLERLPEVASVRSITRPLGKFVADEVGTQTGTQGGVGGFLSRLGQNSMRALGARALRAGAESHYVSTGATRPTDVNRITRIDVLLTQDPYSTEALDALDAVRGVVAEMLVSGSLRGGRAGYAGATAEIYDLRSAITVDERRMYVLVTGGVFLILVYLLRRPGICLYLIATVVVGYLATLGITDLVFAYLHPGPEPWTGLDWKVSFFLFVILVAVGEDYNIFLMSRVLEEEEKHGAIEGTRRAVAHTGGIISSCGLIMAGTFGAMLTGKLLALRELGFALCIGVLLDTFVVRPILVPAFVVLLHRNQPVPEPEPARNGTPPATPTNGSAGRNGAHQAPFRSGQPAPTR